MKQCWVICFLIDVDVPRIFDQVQIGSWFNVLNIVDPRVNVLTGYYPCFYTTCSPCMQLYEAKISWHIRAISWLCNLVWWGCEMSG